MGQFTEAVLWSALDDACARRGIAHDDAQLVHHYSNAVFALPGAGVVVRFTTSLGTRETIDTSQAAVRRLVRDHGFPATAPLDDVPPIHLDDGLTASFWRYYPQPAVGRKFVASDLALLLRRLHDLPTLDAVLPRWEPLASLRGELDRGGSHAGLTSGETGWLQAEVAVVTQQVTAASWPLGVGLIHGDAWAGNLLWDGDQPILGDWDGTAIGPREIDLIPTWHAATRYGRTPEWVDEFAAAYGHDLATSEAFTLLLRMRDLVQITGPLRRAADSAVHRAALRQRFEAIRDGHRAATWVVL